MDNIQKIEIESTRASYASTARRIERLTGKSLVLAIKNYKETIHKIENSNYSFNTKRQTVSLPHTLISKWGLEVPKRAQSAWAEAFKKYKKEGVEAQLSNVLSPKAQEGYIEQSDLIRVRDDPTTSIQDRLLLGMYTFIPPRRVKDYEKLEIVKNEKEAKPGMNVLVLPSKGTASIVIDNFKTRKVLPTYRARLPAELTEIVRESLKGVTRKFLFRHQSLSRHISNTLKRLFNRPATMNTLRHSAVDAFLDEPRTTAEKMEFAVAMGQKNLTTQDAYRNKNRIREVTYEKIEKDGAMYYLVPVEDLDKK